MNELISFDSVTNEIKMNSWGETITVKAIIRRYADGSPRLDFTDVDNGEPTLTATIDPFSLPPRIRAKRRDEEEIFVKNYSENEGVLRLLLDTNLVWNPTDYGGEVWGVYLKPENEWCAPDATHSLHPSARTTVSISPDAFIEDNLRESREHISLATPAGTTPTPTPTPVFYRVNEGIPYCEYFIPSTLSFNNRVWHALSNNLGIPERLYEIERREDHTYLKLSIQFTDEFQKIMNHLSSVIFIRLHDK